MFCTTTTPFKIEDVVATLGKPTSTVEGAWRLLQADFGAQTIFGCGRVEPIPNFYDVVAMAVLIAVLAKPAEVQFATELALEVADETSLVLENSDDENTFSQRNQFCVLKDINVLLDQHSISSQSNLDPKRKHDIKASISSIFIRMRASLASAPNYQTKSSSALNLHSGPIGFRPTV